MESLSIFIYTENLGWIVGGNLVISQDVYHEKKMNKMLHKLFLNSVEI